MEGPKLIEEQDTWNHHQTQRLNIMLLLEKIKMII